MTDPVIAIVSPGSMGAAVGARLRAHGLRVVTPAGRSEASETRARAAGIELVAEDEISEVDFLFAILPPSQAIAAADYWSDRIGGGTRRPLYIDWNAVSPATVERIAARIQAAGGRFADGGIIGLPPGKEGPGPLLFASGDEAKELDRLEGYGIRFQRLDHSIGTASALKMSYAGITKGTIALAAVMLLAAQRVGCGEILVAELARSQAQLLAGFQRSIPDMFDKAARWVPEIKEIAAFIGKDHQESAIYDEMANFYQHFAEDFRGAGEAALALSMMLKAP
jgi:L-threonate 2-dehydrogenase